MRAFTFLVLTSWCGSISAQTSPLEPTRGAFASQAWGVIFEGPESTRDFRYKEPSRPRPAQPFDPAFASALVPDYRFEAIEACIKQAWSIDPAVDIQLEIDAMSTGNDVMPVLWREGPAGTGHFEFVPTLGQQWGTIFLSVSPEAAGLRDGWIEYKASQPGGPGAEIMGFYVEGSVLPNTLPGQVYLEQGIDDFTQGSYPTRADGKPNIMAMDLAMPHIVMWGGQTDPLVMPHNDYLYFSVSKACAQAIMAAPAFVTFEGQPTQLTGGEILLARWTGSWSSLEIAVPHAALDLTADDDLDTLIVGRGLAAGLGGNISDHAFMFSHKKVSPNDGRPQLMMFAPRVELTSGIVSRRGEPRRQGGVLRIPEGADFQFGDDITAGCSSDPEAGYPPRVYGVPVTQGAPLGRAMGFSLTRNPFALQGDGLSCVLSGWAGPRPTGPSFVAVELRNLGDPGPGPMALLPVRQDTEDVYTFHYPLVNPYPGNYWLQIHQLPFTGGGILSSYPVAIKIP